MTTISPQRTLFDEVVVEHTRMSAEEAFAAFCRRNPMFLRDLARMTYEERAKGHRRVSMKLLFERVRSEGLTNQIGPWRIDNSWTSLAARRLVELYPDLADSFELRKRRGE